MNSPDWPFVWFVQWAVTAPFGSQAPTAVMVPSTDRNIIGLPMNAALISSPVISGVVGAIIGAAGGAADDCGEAGRPGRGRLGPSLSVCGATTERTATLGAGRLPAQPIGRPLPGH